MMPSASPAHKPGQSGHWACCETNLRETLFVTSH